MREAYQQYTVLGEQIKWGNLSFADLLLQTSGRLQGEWQSDLKAVMDFAGMSEILKMKRIEQIDAVSNLGELEEILKTLVDLKNKKQLVGDLKFLEAMQSAVRMI